MRKLYYEDTYKKEASCTVLETRKKDKATEVLTDCTIFYPECGGQPGDRGYLGPYEVLDTKKAENGDSVLILKADCPVQVGEALTLKLDWPHRYKFMVMHTAQHMLSGLLFTKFNIGTVAVHLGDEYLTIETNQSQMEPSTIEQLVVAANQAILEAHPVLYHEMSHKEAEALGLRRSIKVEGDVRIVEIKDVDRIACGGVHVAKTSELRLLYCIGHESIRAHVRLYFKVGEEAFSYAMKSIKLQDELCAKFTCSAVDILPKVESLINSLNQLTHAKKELETEVSGYQIEKNIKDGIVTLIVENDLDIQGFQHASNNYDDLAMCVIKVEKDKSLWVIALKGKFQNKDFNELRKNLLPTIGAKGGGKAPLYQGAASTTDKEKLNTFLKEFEAWAKTVF